MHLIVLEITSNRANSSNLRKFSINILNSKFQKTNTIYILFPIPCVFYNFGLGPGATFIPAIGTDKAICVAVSKIIDFSLQLG